LQLIRISVACALLVPLPATAQAGRHPDRRYVDRSIPVTSTVRLSGPRSGPAITLGAPVRAAVGREDGPDHFLFGEIAAVAMNSRGEIVVVDRKVWDVRLFDSRGAFVKQLGGRGQGPGEFQSPHSVLVTPNDEIWIADMQRRLTIFGSSSGGYTLARTIPVEAIGIRSMCLLGGDLIANAVSMGDPYAVRVLDAQARPIRSFGTVYESNSAMLNVQFAEGRVACDETNDLIIHASTASLGEIRAYRRDGQAAWRVVVQDLRSNVITQTEGGYTVEGSPDGAHTLSSLNIVPGLGVLVQYGFRSLADLAAKAPPSDYVTIVIDQRTGAGAISPSALPRLGTVSGNRVIVLFEDPAPRLEVRELRR
jgi:hypothetical protein